MDLNQRILQKGVTKAQVAKMVGIGRATLSKILKNDPKYPATTIIPRIEKYLDRINTDDPTLLDEEANK